MIDLITLDEARAHLGITFDHDDINLQSYVTAASLDVLSYINGDSTTYDLPSDVPENVKQAVRIMVGYYDENRAGEGWAVGIGLPPVVVSLLSDLHTPVTR